METTDRRICQYVQLTFSSEQPSYEGVSAIPTNLEIENQSDQPIYLPWGINPGYNLIPHSTSINQKTHKNNLFSLKTQGFRQVWFSPNG
jgi:hypothetical protein